MELSIKLHTVMSEWSIVDNEGSKVNISQKYCIVSLKIDFAIANSVDPDEMQHYAAFHLGLHCLSKKYPFRGFLSSKGKSKIIRYIFLKQQLFFVKQFL